MRHTKRTALLPVLALLAALLLTACSGTGKRMEDAAGTYLGQYSKMVSDNAREAGSFSLILKADGTGIYARDDSEYTVTWTLDGERFTMQEDFLGISKEYTGTLQNSVLDVFDGDPDGAWTYEYVFQKQ